MSSQELQVRQELQLSPIRSSRLKRYMFYLKDCKVDLP